MTTTCIRRRHAVWTTCPCPPCTADRNKKAKLARNGYYNRVPVEEAWQVVNQLTHHGWSGQAIASAADIPRRAIERALEDRRLRNRLTRFGPSIARAIVNHGDPTAGTVGAHGTRRRLRGLARQRYDLRTIAEATGVGFSTLAAIRNGTTTRVRATFYTTIRDYTTSVGVKVGPSQPAALHAERAGWESLFAWDAIDNPDEVPHGVRTLRHRAKTDLDHAVVDGVLAGERLEMTRAERVEVVRRLRDDWGWSEERIKAHTGIAKATDRNRYPTRPQEDAA